MKNTSKNKLIRTLSSLFFYLVGGFTSLNILFKNTNVNYFLLFILVTYAIFELIKFIYLKDKLSLTLSINTTITAIALLFLNYLEELLILEFILMVFIVAIAYTKFKRIDKSYSKQETKGLIGLINISLLILTGILTIANIATFNNSIILLISYFIFILATLDLLEVLFESLLEIK